VPRIGVAGLWLIAIAASGCGAQSVTAPSPLPAPAGPAARISRTRFLAFGDSVTAGVTSPALSLLAPLSAGLPESYPFKLQSSLTGRYPSQVFDILNEGKPGEAAFDGMRRFPEVRRAFAPEVVILLHGVNDVTFLGGGSRRVAEYVNAMAREARLGGSEVMVCTYPPQRPGGFRAAEPGVMTAYNDALRDVARGEGAILVDFEREVGLGVIGFDGVHPTDAGYDRMAAVLFDLLRARYETAATDRRP
jgi:lysophospholipase L1-like esterase